MKTGSSIAWDDTKVSVNTFTSRKMYRPATPQENEAIKNLPFLRYQDIEDIDNPEKYEWYEWSYGPRDKYNRLQYCPKTKIKRSQTMGEFYGNSTVD